MKLVEVIQYEGDNKTFVYKSTVENFHTGSQLIVHESQRAIFFMNGHMLDSFPPGKHTLTTQNLPFMKNFLGKILENNTPFHCEVYFVNMTEQMGIKWGLAQKVDYADATYNGAVFKIGASGTMSLQVQDERKLLLKLVGTEHMLSQDVLKEYFKPDIEMAIKSYLPQVLEDKGKPIYEIDRYLSEFSQDMKKQLEIKLAEYGIKIPNFCIMNFVKPEDDPVYMERLKNIAAVPAVEMQERIRDIQAAKMIQRNQQKELADIELAAARNRALGITEQEKRAYDIACKAAENPGVGNFTSTGIGLGTMAGVGSGLGMGLGHAVAEAIKPIYSQPADMSITPVASPVMLNLKEEAAQRNDLLTIGKKPLKEQLKELQEAFGDGYITQEEYEKAREKLLEF